MTTAPETAAAELLAELPPSPAVWCTGLRKRYGRRHAVEGVGLAVGRGEVVGLLGPNGAGKTTVIKMLLGLVRPELCCASELVATRPELVLVRLRAREGSPKQPTELADVVEQLVDEIIQLDVLHPLVTRHLAKLPRARR